MAASIGATVRVAGEGERDASAVEERDGSVGGDKRDAVGTISGGRPG